MDYTKLAELDFFNEKNPQPFSLVGEFYNGLLLWRPRNVL